MIEQNICEEVMLEKAKNQALKYITVRMRSRLEMLQYLRKKNYSPEIIQRVLDFLEHYDYLNDTHFCRLWVEDKKRFHPCGRQKMKVELRKKGISSTTIDEVLTEVYSEEEEYDVALQLTEKHQGKAENDDLQRGKLGRYLYSKGFSAEIIEQVLAEIF